MNTMQRREIHPEIRVLDSKAGLVEYIASDETLDSYKEIIRADGWRFSRFSRNAPFVDSHDYASIEKLLGSVVDFRVEGRRLIETVRWAVDVEENRLAKIGFAMTEAGHLKAVSVGFQPVRWVDRWQEEGRALAQLAAEMGLAADAAAAVRTIYIEQEQVELSACIIGANPGALCRAYKAGVLADGDIEFVAETFSKGTEHTAREAEHAAAAARAEERRQQFLRKFETITRRLKS